MRRYWFWFAAVVGCALAGCADLYMPRFDGGLENPDIRLLRVTEFMNGVKCGLVAFIHEREHKLLQDRIIDERGMYRNIEAGGKSDGKYPRVYSPFQLKMTANMPRCEYGWHAKCTTAQCPDRQNWKCVKNPCDAALDTPEGDFRLGVALWDYSKNKCVAIPDYSRFALDDTQTATIQLKMTAVNSGFIHFNKIDAVKSGLFPFVAAGGGAAGNLFPTLNIDPKRTTTFDLSVNIPQSVHTFSQTVTASALTGVGHAEQVVRARADILADILESQSLQAGQLLKFNPNFQADDWKRSLYTRPGNSPSGLGEQAAKIGQEIYVLRDRASALPGSYPNWEATIQSALSKLDAERLSIIEIDQSWPKLNDGEKKAKAAEEENRLARLSDELLKDTTDLRSALEHDENIREYTNVVLKNFTDYIKNLPRPFNADSVSLAQQTLADKSEKLMSRVLEIRDKTLMAERLKFVEQKLGELRDDLSNAREAVDKDADAKAAAEKAKAAEDAANKAFKEQKLDHEFDEQCKPDAWSYVVDGKTRIDFLGLKSVLENLFEREEKIYRGIPDLSLSQLILTSEFQLSLEVSAGLNYVRFIPIVAAPGGDFKADHTHNLKVTLNGKKIKNAPGNNTGSKSLTASCEQRVTGGTAPSDNYCATPQGQLLENILQTLQNNSGGTSAQ